MWLLSPNWILSDTEEVGGDGTRVLKALQQQISMSCRLRPLSEVKSQQSLSYRGILKESELEAQGKVRRFPSSGSGLAFRLSNVQFNSSC